MSLALARTGTTFLDGYVVPDHLVATSPPESRGRDRDEVRLMVSSARGLSHHAFTDLAEILDPGDLVVVNNSRTLPASVVAGDRVFNLSTVLDGGFAVVEPRIKAAVGSTRDLDAAPGRFSLPGDGTIELLSPFPHRSPSRRLWLATLEIDRPLFDYLDIYGEPIRYPYVAGAHPLADYQTIFATEPGSAEMPSAGRPFSGRVLASLSGRGVAIAPITLHTGVSSLESGEPPYAERFRVTENVAALINHTRSEGGRVIAVGTTVVRALESVVDRRGRIHPADSVTDLVIGENRTIRSVDGLITGWHQTGSTHLEMLAAFFGHSRLEGAYQAALDDGYLWHEFGDSLLLLP
ncbi:MAG TPA: S-adenosylmethionine:tRNA ribosyltransferase-isomerase [Acidimicrobiia bacterium]